MKKSQCILWAGKYGMFSHVRTLLIFPTSLWYAMWKNYHHSQIYYRNLFVIFQRIAHSYHLSVDYNYYRCLGAMSEVHVGLNINVIAVQ